MPGEVFGCSSGEMSSTKLLPCSHTEFKSVEYWDEFFKKRGTKAFEWYGEYPDMCGILHKYVKPKDSVLMAGCGNSQLSADMYDVGYHSITNVDISDIVIKQMHQKNREQRPKMAFLKMDVKQLQMSDDWFNVVIDKGTLDALMVDSSEAVIADIDKMFSEISRVLKQGGRYICISLLQDHILRKLVSYFTDLGWPIRSHRIFTEDLGNNEFRLPVFAFILTKFKKMSSMLQILETCHSGETVERVKTEEEFISQVKDQQYYSMIRHNLSKRNVSDEQIKISLHDAASNMPRYSLFIVDRPDRCSNTFAIFLVPQGRETDWMFSTGEGRQQFSQTTDFQRLVVVLLHRNQEYASLQAIQDELSPNMMELAPPSYKKGTRVPFLSLGSDVGTRNIRFEGHSPLSGDFVVEDIEGDNKDMFRRLVFLSNQFCVQSEARIIPVVHNKKRQKGEIKHKIDRSYLPFDYHHSMIAAFAFVDNVDQLIGGGLRVLIIGLGGGGLTLFLHEHLPQIHIDVVDIDPVIVSVAKDWFGFPVSDDTLCIHVDDGLKFVHNRVSEGMKYHIIIFDVDSKDLSVGMSCPPKEFVEHDFLLSVEKLLHNEGVFLLNIAARDETLRKEVVSELQNTFQQVYLHLLGESVNVLSMSLPHGHSVLTWEPDAGKSQLPEEIIVKIRDISRRIQRKRKCDLDLIDSLSNLSLTLS